VTNLRWKSSNVVKFYNKRGTAEQWIKEGKYALNWTRLSCHDFVDNQVRLNPVRHKDCGVIYGGRITQNFFLHITYFKLARCTRSCLNAFHE